MSLKRKKKVYMEVQIVPFGGSIEKDLKSVMKLVKASGFSVSTSVTGATIEGEWKDVFCLLERCHDILIDLSKIAFISTNIRMKVQNLNHSRQR